VELTSCKKEVLELVAQDFATNEIVEKLFMATIP